MPSETRSPLVGRPVEHRLCQGDRQPVAFRAYEFRRMTTLVARAPTRLAFGGGGADVPPYSEEEGGFVCNIAITRYATVRVRHANTGERSVDTRRAADTALA